MGFGAALKLVQYRNAPLTSSKGKNARMAAMKRLLVAWVALALALGVSAGDINSSLRTLGKPKPGDKSLGGGAPTTSATPSSPPAEQFGWYDWSI